MDLEDLSTFSAMFAIPPAVQLFSEVAPVPEEHAKKRLRADDNVCGSSSNDIVTSHDDDDDDDDDDEADFAQCECGRASHLGFITSLCTDCEVLLVPPRGLGLVTVEDAERLFNAFSNGGESGLLERKNQIRGRECYTDNPYFQLLAHEKTILALRSFAIKYLAALNGNGDS